MSLKQIVRKANLVKYCWYATHESRIPLWCTDYLLDKTDRDTVVRGVEFEIYDLSRGVYLYKSIRNKFKLIAVITNKGIKIYDNV